MPRYPMTPGLFKSIACAIIGDNTYWQKPIARRLGVSRETIRRWMMLEQVPDHAEAKIWELWIGPVSQTMLLIGSRADYEHRDLGPGARVEAVYRVMREQAFHDLRDQANGN